MCRWAQKAAWSVQMVRNNLVNHSRGFPLNWHTSALIHVWVFGFVFFFSSQVSVIYPGGIKDWKEKKKGKKVSLSGLLPYEHQSFAQGSVWAYNCYWYLSKCVFSSHLQPHSVSAQNNDPSVLLPLEQSTRLLGKESAALTAVPWWSLLPNGLLLQLEWEPWLGPLSFQTAFLEQKTEKGFHSSNKMDLSLLVTPSERWGWSFSLVHLPISLTLSFLSPVNMKNKWLNTKK